MKKAPLVNKTYKLEKFPGKGGWTYARIDDIPPDKKKPFGWVKVRGSIDGFEFRKYHLMPMGNGFLFLGVKAEIRKKIRKEAGDSVHIILYHDNEPLEVPAEMLLCLKDEPAAFEFFESLSEAARKSYVDFVYSARNEETKIERLAETVTRLAQRRRLDDA